MSAIPQTDPQRARGPRATSDESSGESDRDEVIVDEVVPTRRRRQPKWILLGVALVCLSALGAVVLWNTVSGTNTVLQLNRTVYRGEVIEGQDLSPVTVGRLGAVVSVPSSEMSEYVGRPARTDLVAGTLLPPDAVGGVDLPADSHIVGLKLSEGRYPTITMEPGTQVLLVETRATDTGDSEGTQDSVWVFEAQIHSRVEPSDDHTGITVDVVVHKDEAPQVALLAAEGRLAMVRGT